MGSVLGLVTSEKVFVTIVSLAVSIVFSSVIVFVFSKSSFKDIAKEENAGFAREPLSTVDNIITSIVAIATLSLLIAAC